jgi:ferredoxin
MSETKGASEKYSQRNEVLVQVDHELCVGFAECVAVAPQVFALNEDGLAVVVDPDAVDLDALEEAAEVCPVSAILLLGSAGAEVTPGS